MIKDAIHTIKITNGINLDKINLRIPTLHSGFVLVGVAHLGDWHGYDRVIEGIGQYYRMKGNPEEITFYIIGSNEKVYDKYIALAKKFKIEKRIRFEGIKSGKELDSYFDMADFAISGLGGHRKGVFEAKALKSIEYAARGIPFICSDRDDDMAKWPFVLHAPQNDSYINIQEMLDFIKSNKMEPSEIRKYVEKGLTWDAQMKVVVDELYVLQ